MAGINETVLVGRLTKDCEIKKTQNGTAVTQFSLAVDRQITKEQKANGQQSADFITCIAWKQRAEFLGNYGKKGDMVAVQGRIQTRNYKNQRGETVYVTDVIADNVQILSSKSHEAPQNTYNQKAESVAQEKANNAVNIDSSDLPF